MGWSEEFGKLHNHYKMCLVVVAILMPFWYVEIFVFDRPLFNLGNFNLLLSLCFILSITWFAINTVAAFAFILLTNQFLLEKDEDKFDFTINEILRYGSMFSFVTLSIEVGTGIYNLHIYKVAAPFTAIVIKTYTTSFWATLALFGIWGFILLFKYIFLRKRSATNN